MYHQEIFKYKSIGVKHNEEVDFFKFVVRQEFFANANRSIEWCTFDGLNIICTSIEPSIIDYVKIVLSDFIETKNGHKWELIKDN